MKGLAPHAPALIERERVLLLVRAISNFLGDARDDPPPHPPKPLERPGLSTPYGATFSRKGRRDGLRF
jgi:hypothetical protein